MAAIFFSPAKTGNPITRNNFKETLDFCVKVIFHLYSFLWVTAVPETLVSRWELNQTQRNDVPLVCFCVMHMIMCCFTRILNFSLWDITDSFTFTLIYLAESTARWLNNAKFPYFEKTKMRSRSFNLVNHHCLSYIYFISLYLHPVKSCCSEFLYKMLLSVNMSTRWPTMERNSGHKLVFLMQRFTSFFIHFFLQYICYLYTLQYIFLLIHFFTYILYTFQHFFLIHLQ